MRPSKITAVVILLSFASQLLGCHTIKLVRPGQKPERLKSKKITVVTTDQRAYTFSEIRVYSDTLYGVFGIKFPEDRYSPEVISIPYSNIESIYYRGTNSALIASWVFIGLAALAVTAIAIGSARNSSWGY